MLRFLFLLLLAALLLGMQDESVTLWQARRKAYPELVATYDLAQLAPAALRSLALRKVAGTPNLHDAKWKLELVKESFEAGAAATQKWPENWVPEPPGPMPKLPRRVVKQILAHQGLDRLTLQTAAIEAMLPLDPIGARAAFDRISYPDPGTLGCAAGLVPDVSSYFSAAGSIAARAFTPEQKKRHEDVEFLRGVILRVTSPVQIGPAAKLAARNKADLSPALAQRLTAISGDDRAFSHSLLRDTALVLDLDIPHAWRAYLVSNLSGPRCSESVDEKHHFVADQAAVLQSFRLRAANVQGVAPIEPEEVVPGRIEGGVADEPVERSAADQSYFLEWVALANDQQNTEDATAKIDAIVNRIEDLKPVDGEDSLELTWRKCGSLGGLLTVLKPGPNYDRVMGRYLTLLRVSELPPERLPEWYSLLQTVIHLGKGETGDRTVVQAMEQTGHPLLALVARLERMPK